MTAKYKYQGPLQQWPAKFSLVNWAPMNFCHIFLSHIPWNIQPHRSDLPWYIGLLELYQSTIFTSIKILFLYIIVSFLLTINRKICNRTLSTNLPQNQVTHLTGLQSTRKKTMKRSSRFSKFLKILALERQPFFFFSIKS